MAAALWLATGLARAGTPEEKEESQAGNAERVQVGQEAPDFQLQSEDGTAHVLSSLHGDRNVVLIFFRGHW